MNVKLMELLAALAGFQPLFGVLALMFFLAALVILVSVAVKKIEDAVISNKKRKVLQKEN